MDDAGPHVPLSAVLALRQVSGILRLSRRLLEVLAVIPGATCGAHRQRRLPGCERACPGQGTAMWPSLSVP